MYAPGRKGVDCSETADPNYKEPDPKPDGWQIPFIKIAKLFGSSGQKGQVPNIQLPNIPSKSGNSANNANQASNANNDANRPDGCLDCDPPQSLRECAKCCSHTCEETCHCKTTNECKVSNISTAVYSFPDCFFGCQRSCVKDCPKTPGMPCGRKAASDGHAAPEHWDKHAGQAKHFAQDHVK